MISSGTCVSAAAVVAIHFAAVGAQPAVAADPEPLPIGAAAPDVSLPGVDDKTHALADYAEANVLVVVFTCNHCPTAQAYEARIKQLVDDYQDRGVAVVAISPNDAEAVRLDELGYADLGDSLEDMKTRARDHEFNFPYLYDGESQSVALAYGPVTTPHVFVFDADRRLRYRGRIDDHENPAKVKTHDTRNAIDALLAGKPVPVETTRTIGCSIKWSDKRESAREALARWDRETAELKVIDEQGLRDLVANPTDKLRLINVWSTTCGPCVIEFPELVAMHRMYRQRDFELVTITTDPPERRDAALKFLNAQHASTTNYIFAEDDPYKLAEALSVDWQGALPYTMLVKPGGEIVYQHMGPIDPLEVRRAIVDVMSRYYFVMQVAAQPAGDAAGEADAEAAGEAASAAGSGETTSAPKPDKDGWYSLFDGKTLNGWRAAETPTSFRVEDGVLIAGGGERGHLFYNGPVQNHDFKNFELKLEVMTEPNANSGIYFHTKYQDEGWPGEGYECQVNNSFAPDPRRTASLYGIKDVAESPVKDREWFDYHIIVNGKKITIKINDKTIVEYTEAADPPQFDGRDRKLSHGTIALQAHDPGSIVRYRNIRIKPLP
jgi:peroxiredoxin